MVHELGDLPDAVRGPDAGRGRDRHDPRRRRGLLLATPLGHLADRAGAREVLIGTLVLQAVGTLAYLQVHSFALFLPVACLTVALDHSSGGVGNALVIGLTKAKDSTHALSSLRSLGHLGWAAGAAVGAVVIGLDTREAYVALVVVNAASFLGYAGLLRACHDSTECRSQRKARARRSCVTGPT